MTANALTAVARKGDQLRAITVLGNLTLLLSVSYEQRVVEGRWWDSPAKARQWIETVAEDWDLWDFGLLGEPMPRDLTQREIDTLEAHVLKQRKFVPDDYTTNLLLGVA